MAYVITDKLLFNPKELTKEEASDLELFIEKVIIDGYVDMSHPAWVAWFTAAGFNESQQLLVYSTVFPQRALLSVIGYCHTKID